MIISKLDDVMVDEEDYIQEKVQEIKNCEDCKKFVCYRHSQNLRDSNGISAEILKQVEQDYINYDNKTINSIVANLSTVADLEDDDLTFEKSSNGKRIAGIKSKGWKKLYSKVVNECG